MAQSAEEERRRRRRRRLARGLLLGSAAIGLPAAWNALVARRARALPRPRWGSQERVQAGAFTTSFRRLGEGSPLVLLHSLGPGHTGDEWREAAPRLARDVEVVVPDLPGWGGSPADIRQGEAYVPWLRDFVAATTSGRAVLVAAGTSAAFAVRMAVEAPEQVRALALVTPRGVPLAGETPELGDSLVQSLLRVPVLGTSALNVITTRSALERYLRREVYYDPDRVTAEMVASHYRAAHLPGAHTALTAQLRGRLLLDVTPMLERVQQEVWICWGREAMSPAVESADLWLQRLPRADLEVFSGSGLLPHREIPQLFAAALSRFLARLPE